MRHRWKLVSLVLVLVLFVLSACSGKGASKSDPASGQGADKVSSAKILQSAFSGIVTTWDPSVSYSNEVHYLANIYEGLVYAKPDGTFEGRLATEWEASKDGLTWTFHLRKGVKFHDGEPFTADAVRKSILRTKEAKKGPAYMWAPVTDIQAKDENTVVFILKEPQPLTTLLASEYGAWIMSPKVIDKDSKWFDVGRAAGTGPYKLASYKSDEEAVLERNPDYWGGWKEKQFEKIVVKVVKDDLTQRQMVESGAVEAANMVPVDSIPALEKNSKLTVAKYGSFTNFVIFLNTRKAPTDNVKVRQALSYAINYTDVMQVGAAGLATQARGPVPKGLWPNDDSLPQYSYNPEKAKQLLKEAGAEGATIDFNYYPDSAPIKNFAPLIKENWEKIGLKVNAKQESWKLLYEQSKATPPTDAKAHNALTVRWWPGYSDGYDNLSGMFATEKEPVFNFAFSYNKDFDDNIAKAFALSATDRPKAKEMYIQAQKQLIEQAPAIYLFDQMETYVFTKQVTGFVPNANYPKVLNYYQLSR